MYNSVNFYISGGFLYMLGKPRSYLNNDTDKRIISHTIQKTGPACTLEMTMWYKDLNGASIEFGIQTITPNKDQASSRIGYLPFHYIPFIDDLKGPGKIKNDTSNNWKTFRIPVHQYSNNPFQLSIDVRRSKSHSPSNSFLAIDELKLVNCAPRKSTNPSMCKCYIKMLYIYIYML